MRKRIMSKKKTCTKCGKVSKHQWNPFFCDKCVNPTDQKDETGPLVKTYDKGDDDSTWMAAARRASRAWCKENPYYDKGESPRSCEAGEGSCQPGYDSPTRYIMLPEAQVFFYSMSNVVAEAYETHAKIVALKAERDVLKAEKDKAYRERNHVIAGLSKVFTSHLMRHPEDGLWEDDWMWIVCINLPTGQATWHIHDTERHLFDHLLVKDNTWDGHDIEEKYHRLDKLASHEEIDRLRAALAEAIVGNVEFTSERRWRVLGKPWSCSKPPIEAYGDPDALKVYVETRPVGAWTPCEEKEKSNG